MEENNFDYTVNGVCPEGCHKCCANILTVSKEEITRIKKYIAKNKIEINNHNTIFGGYIDKCPFVNKQGKCNIYEVRPEVCSYYSCHNIHEYRPFNHQNKEVVNMLLTFKPDAYCPDAPDIKALNSIYQTRNNPRKNFFVIGDGEHTFIELAKPNPIFVLYVKIKSYFNIHFSKKEVVYES